MFASYAFSPGIGHNPSGVAMGEYMLNGFGKGWAFKDKVLPSKIDASKRKQRKNMRKKIRVAKRNGVQGRILKSTIVAEARKCSI